ncbi:hypothetical protein CC85DRAFT_168104 [Cutaneotrichosporon oleaginosum]|uniref:Uncharacterized protein n=1 Tax=Cutaneotrichosporon oleaginosum TaxID=879819 RepID=A0A0J0XFV1_9TREE|nr:uncharacterized protein CC85DRAFT_168104 [Cutaneotrichosporon oleaginosum]KLT39950.1 hypothetical protein CC85DRAFT_168104 [Cutaneotrichosporon oleaginosum]TXT08363.1 hypothetical protein COLE_05287 [Cutaneotrichosporon oleaginosum]
MGVNEKGSDSRAFCASGMRHCGALRKWPAYRRRLQVVQSACISAPGSLVACRLPSSSAAQQPMQPTCHFCILRLECQVISVAVDAIPRRSLAVHIKRAWCLASDAHAKPSRAHNYTCRRTPQCLGPWVPPPHDLAARVLAGCCWIGWIAGSLDCWIVSHDLTLTRAVTRAAPSQPCGWVLAGW